MVERGRTTSNREYALSVSHARKFLSLLRRLDGGGWDGAGHMEGWWELEQIALMVAEYGGGRQ